MAMDLNTSLDIDEEEKEDNGSIHLILTDTDVLNCPVCFTTFNSPVFECDNGHAICSSCYTKLKKKKICPTCYSPVGTHRCWAIEKLLESLKAVCQNSKYGCKETASYCNKLDHEMRCHHAPCSCPLSDCNFIGSYRDLNYHFNVHHKNSAFLFRYRTEISDSFHVTISVNEKVMFLKEKKQGDLFVLSNKRIENFANAITVSCIAPSWKKENSCVISCKCSKSRCLSFKFVANNIQETVDDDLPLVGCLLVPCDFFDSNGQLKLCIEIHAGDSDEDSDSS